MQNNKPSMLLVDRRALHRERIGIRLDTVYEVADFALLDDAMRHARRFPPDAMVICEDQARGEDFYFLQSMRLEPAFQSLPIIVILAEENAAQSARALAAGANACLAKPYLPSTLVSLISAAISKACERKWSALPKPQEAALRSTVAMFDKVAARVAAGQPICYPDIETAAAPLLEAVDGGGTGDLLRGVREHDNYAYAHSLRVAVFLSVFGRNIGLPLPELATLTAGGLLLDIGKTTIPPLLLNKQGHLTNAEVDIMRGHVGASMALLEKSPGLPDSVLVIAGQHHEKLDGSGYPHALPGSQLNELARMAAIADVFSALTERRVYKPALTAEDAFGLMADEMAAQLDMRLLRYFRQLVHDLRISHRETHGAR